MKSNLFLWLIAAFVLASCGPSTQIEKSWVDPEVQQNPKPFTKTLFIALLKDESTRRITEDKLVAMSRSKGVQSYTYFTDADLKMTDEELTKKIKADGFDGVVVMSLSDVDKSQTYVPGSSPGYYGTWSGYYRYAAPYYSDPGYYRTDKTYYIETSIYSLVRGKLVWTGTTSTVNPTNVEKMIDEIATVIKDKMRQQGLLK